MKRYTLALLASLIATTAAMPVRAEFFLSVNIAPPELPVYVQPALPGEGYVWTPGYWAYDEGDYYWVPGTWIRPPRVGLLWTPGYWAWNVSAFSFRPGYWGTQVGYYGGVNYGYGYGGRGYDGGRWERDHFMYNRAVNNISSTNVRNTYTATVVKTVTVNRVSYTGGTGGLSTRATADEQRFEREKHVAATTAQVTHEKTARAKPELRRAVNKGRPSIAATAKPAEFNAPDVVPAQGAHPKPVAAKADVAKKSGTAAAKPEQRKGTASNSNAGPTTAKTESKPDTTRTPAAGAKSDKASKAVAADAKADNARKADAAAQAKTDQANKAAAADAKADNARKADAAAQAKTDQANKAAAADAKADNARKADAAAQAKSDKDRKAAAAPHAKPERDSPQQANRPEQKGAAAQEKPKQTTAQQQQQKPKSQPQGAPGHDGKQQADKEARRVQKDAEEKPAKPTTE